MQAHELIGKKAIRRRPSLDGQNGFMTDGVTILAATADHIIVEHHSIGIEGARTILNYTWLDDNWISYDDLMALVPIKD